MRRREFISAGLQRACNVNCSVDPYFILFAVSDSAFAPGRGAMMLDHPEKTARTLADLKAAAPFEAELARPVFEHLQSENVVEANRGITPCGTCPMAVTKVAFCVTCRARKKQERHSLSP